MYGLEGGLELYFFENRPLASTVWAVLPFLIRFQTFLSPAPHLREKL